jgi:hypothetical protein
MNNQGLNLKPVDVVEDITRKEFIERYLKPGLPVKIKKFTQAWPANQKWSYPYLKEKLGHQQVKLYGKWTENEPTRIEMPPVKEVPFADYLDLVESGEPSDLRMFLFNPFKLDPSLLEDFSFPDLTDNYLKDFPYMFFGAAGSDVRLHYDIDLSHVFISQFAGTKRFVLFDQDQTKYLYKIPFTTHSAADLMHPDFEKHPALTLAKGYECFLEPGETLFMPSGIWHYIQYVNGSFSLSLRSITESHLDKLKGAYNVIVIRKLDEYLNKYYGQKWGDYKLKKAMENTNEILKNRGYF